MLKRKTRPSSRTSEKFSQRLAIQKKPVNRYFRAGAIFLRTPFIRAKRGFPEPLSGTKRKFFSLNAFVAEAWKTAAKRKVVNTHSFLTAEAFSDYVCRIDDILDQLVRPSIITEQAAYKKDRMASQTLSRFVGQVKQLPLTRQEKKEIFRLAGDFRRRAFAELAKFEKTFRPTKQDIIKLKEHTTGGFARIGISILNVCERIPQEKRRELEDAFSNSFMATQIADDIFDLRKDIRNRVPNITLAVLNEHPAELKQALKKQKMNIFWFRKKCPQSYKELLSLCNGYISQIPQTTTGLQTLAAIPRILLKLLSFTSR